MAILWRPTLQRLLEWAEAGFDTLVSVAGPFFIILAVVLIGGCAYLYFSAIVPYLFPEWTVLALLNMLVSVWIVANMTFNYFTCVFTKPGSPALTNVGIMALFFFHSEVESFPEASSPSLPFDWIGANPSRWNKVSNLWQREPRYAKLVR